MIMPDFIKLLGGEDTIEIDHRYISFYRFIEFIKTLPTVKILKKRSWVLTDDYWVDFEYKGYVFQIESPFVDYWVNKHPDCPEYIFKEIYNHLCNMKPRFIYKLFVKIKNILSI